MPRLDVARGARLALIGESGSGKSTLLELLAMILQPDASGRFAFRPRVQEPAIDLADAWRRRDADALGDLRSRHLGYVLQTGGLLPYLSVRANIELPRALLGLAPGDSAQRLAGRLGLSQQLDRYPAALSVGQRQRVAIARALAHEPPIVIADEPTAAIDPPNAERIMRLMTELADEFDVTLIVATHAQALAERTGFTLVALQFGAVDETSMTATVSHG